jgi:hypothetical protein
MKTSSAVILAMVLTACDPAKPPENTGEPVPRVEEPLTALAAKYSQKTVDLLLTRIRAELPEGWHASYEREYSVLEVAREEAVWATGVVPNGPSGQKPERTKFTFAFRVFPFVSTVEHRQMNAENTAIERQLEVLHEELEKKKLTHKGEAVAFFAKTDEEKEAVARYKALDDSRHDLPELYFADLSLAWLYGQLVDPDWGRSMSFEDERVREECMQTQKRVLALLSRYEVFDR